MSNSGFIYEEKEDLVILNEVKATPQNLSSAFKRAAIKLDRTPAAVSMYWYSVLKKKYPNTFVTASKETSTSNTKVETPKVTLGTLTLSQQLDLIQLNLNKVKSIISTLSQTLHPNVIEEISSTLDATIKLIK